MNGVAWGDMNLFLCGSFWVGLFRPCLSYWHRAASELEPTHFRARKLLGSAQYALADLPAARDALTAALSLRPDYADAHCDLGARSLLKTFLKQFG